MKNNNEMDTPTFIYSFFYLLSFLNFVANMYYYLIYVLDSNNFIFASEFIAAETLIVLLTHFSMALWWLVSIFLLEKVLISRKEREEEKNGME